MFLRVEGVRVLLQMWHTYMNIPLITYSFPFENNMYLYNNLNVLLKRSIIDERYELHLCVGIQAFWIKLENTGLVTLNY